MLQNISIVNKCCTFELSIHQRASEFPLKYSSAQLISTLL